MADGYCIVVDISRIDRARATGAEFELRLSLRHAGRIDDGIACKGDCWHKAAEGQSDEASGPEQCMHVQFKIR